MRVVTMTGLICAAMSLAAILKYGWQPFFGYLLMVSLVLAGVAARDREETVAEPISQDTPQP